MPTCRPFTPEQVAKIYRSFSGRWKVRNRTLFIFSASTGFRAQEALSVRRGDVIDRSGAIRETVMVKAEHMKGKEGRKRSRSVDLTPVAISNLEEWTQLQKKLGFDDPESSLWTKSDGNPISYIQWWKALKVATIAAGLPYSGFATHSMRKTFAGDNYRRLVMELKAGTNSDDPIVALCEMMGHASTDSTMKYIPKPEIKRVLMQHGSDWNLLDQAQPPDQ